MPENGEKVKALSRTKDIALLDHARKDVLQALEFTEEAKRELALKPLEEAIRDADIFATFRDHLKRSGAALSVINQANRIRLWNRRRAGLILREMAKNRGGWDSPSCGDIVSPQEHPPTYADLGIEKKPAQRLQDESRVPEEIFEEHVSKVIEADEREITASEIEKMGRRLRIELEKADWQADESLSGSIELVHQGALEYLPSIESASVDLLLTDPPYSTDIPDIGAFARSWLNLALSRVKPGGRAYVFIGSYPAEIHAYLDAYYRPRPGGETHYMNLDMILPWTYRNTMGPSTKETYKLNWQACLYFIGPDASPLNSESLNEKFSVQDINAPDGRFGLRLHPWQKPDELAERFIRHATEPGQVVLDPFAGTGTFLAAAARLGRNAIGCEVDEEMLAFCKQRGLLP
jgi:site-specific DNA-methyltransferase (adenine-specific)